MTANTIDRNARCDRGDPRLRRTSATAQQAYPAKPIKIIVPFHPAAPPTSSRAMVGQKLSENTKQPVIVENRPGADTIIAMEAVASAPADGYTVGYAIGSALTMNPTLYSKLPYDPTKDFAPVTLIVNKPLALVVHPSVPAKTAKELADYIKANPGKLFYGQANIVAKVATEAFSAAAGGKMVEVPYKGSTSNVQDLILGRVQVSIEPVATILPYVKDGKLRALAVTDSRARRRSPICRPSRRAASRATRSTTGTRSCSPPRRPRKSSQHAARPRSSRRPSIPTSPRSSRRSASRSSPAHLRSCRSARPDEREHWAKQIKALGIKVD